MIETYLSYDDIFWNKGNKLKEIQGDGLGWPSNT